MELTRKRFVQTSAAAGAALAMGGPLSALAGGQGRGRNRRAVGYGPLQPTAAEGTDVELLALPAGFAYKVISRSGDPMSDGNPTPNVFDGMAAYQGRGNRTVLIRNHEHRSRDGEIPVLVPQSMRYDPDPNTRGGNTKLVVDRRRDVVESFAILGGTHTNCAGGSTPWNTWITAEEVFNYGATGSAPGQGVPHGFLFEMPADAEGPVYPVPIRAAGRFSHEAVAWLAGALYETEDRGDAAFYRFRPNREPREFGDLATFGGTLEALVVRGRPNFDADAANVGERYPVEWVTIEEPNPLTDTVRSEAQDKGAAIFNRTEGIWSGDRSVYFDCTSGGEAGLGQLWEFRPRGRTGGDLTLVYESTSFEDLENPDNLVLVPQNGDVLLQEDSGGEQFVRGVDRRGRIYDFAQALVNGSEFCGGCFSPDGETFFLNQQGGRLGAGQTPEDQPDSDRGLTYAIWGPFGAASLAEAPGPPSRPGRDPRGSGTPRF